MEPTLTFSIEKNSYHVSTEKKKIAKNTFENKEKEKCLEKYQYGKKSNLEVYSLQVTFHVILPYGLPQ